MVYHEACLFCMELFVAYKISRAWKKNLPVLFYICKLLRSYGALYMPLETLKSD